MSPQPSPEVYETHCKICGRVFRSEPFLPRIDPAAPLDPRRVKMAQVLLNHVATEHLQHTQGILLAACIQFGDPVIVAEMESIRWQVHTNTAKNYLDDATIEEQFSKIGFDAEQIQAVIQFRDLLTETGRHAVIKPAETQQGKSTITEA